MFRGDMLDSAHLVHTHPDGRIFVSGLSLVQTHMHSPITNMPCCGSPAAFKLQSLTAIVAAVHAHFPVRSYSSPFLHPHSPSSAMPVASRIRFVHFTPCYTDLPQKIYRSGRDTIRGDLRVGFDTTLGESRSCPSVRRGSFFPSA